MSEATLISTGDKPILRFERFLPRSVEEVWRAVTDPAEMRAWFPTRIEIDGWEKGATLIHHFDDVPRTTLPGTVLECSPLTGWCSPGATTRSASSCRPLRAARGSC